MNKLLKKIFQILLIILASALTLAILLFIQSILWPEEYHNEYTFSNTISDTTYSSSSYITRRNFTTISIDPINETYNWNFQLDFFYNSSIKSGMEIPYCRIFKKLTVDTLYIKEFNPYYQINKEFPLIGNYNKQRIRFNIEYKNGGTEFEISRNNQTIYKSSNFPGQEFIFLKAWGNQYDYAINIKVDQYF